MVSFPLSPLMQSKRSCCWRWRRHCVSPNRKTCSRERVCTAERRKEKYLHVQWRHWQDELHIFGCTHPMERHFCVHIRTVLSGEMSRIGIWSFMWNLQQQKVGYPSRNIPLDSIDTNSNWSGGACAMKLEGYDDESNRKMGIWLPSSNSLLEYIQ